MRRLPTWNLVCERCNMSQSGGRRGMDEDFRTFYIEARHPVGSKSDEGIRVRSENSRKFLGEVS